MAWRYENFLSNYKKYGAAYHGANGKIGYYVLKGLATIDIDHEEDFILAEVAVAYKNYKKISRNEYYMKD